MKIENQKLEISVELPQLRQRDVEAYFRAARDLQDGELNVSSPEYLGITVRAACRAGILPGYKEADIDDLLPAAVHVLALGINDHISEALRIPGE